MNYSFFDAFYKGAKFQLLGMSLIGVVTAYGLAGIGVFGAWIALEVTIEATLSGKFLSDKLL